MKNDKTMPPEGGREFLPNAQCARVTPRITPRPDHWPDCALNHGGTECDMGPACGKSDEEVKRLEEAEELAKAELLFTRLDGLLDTRDLEQADVAQRVALTEDQYLALIKKSFKKGYLSTAEAFARALSNALPPESKYFRNGGITRRQALRAWLHTAYRHKEADLGGKS